MSFLRNLVQRHRQSSFTVTKHQLAKLRPSGKEDVGHCFTQSVNYQEHKLERFERIQITTEHTNHSPGIAPSRIETTQEGNKALSDWQGGQIIPVCAP
eukprot:4904514-Amphidinium_carterae.2